MGTYLCLGVTSLLVSETFEFKVLKCDLQLLTINGVLPNISLFICPYRFAPLNYLKKLNSSPESPWSFSVNKGIVKTYLDVDMVKNNWSRIAVVDCGLHYFISVRFGSFWVINNFITVERFKYLFLAAMKFHTMARTLKIQNDFIFSSLVT